MREDEEYDAIIASLTGTNVVPALKMITGMVPEKILQHDNQRVEIHLKSGPIVVFHHHQSCCEDVYLEEVAGDWSSLIGHPILVAEERTDYRQNDYGDEKWTFYTIRSNGGTVDMRWYGASSGYYSIDVDIDVYRDTLEMERMM